MCDRNADGLAYVSKQIDGLGQRVVTGVLDVQLQPASQPAVQENTRGDGRYRILRTRSVVGTINGGGPEFELRTFNSNVYVRKGR